MLMSQKKRHQAQKKGLSRHFEVLCPITVRVSTRSGSRAFRVRANSCHPIKRRFRLSGAHIEDPDYPGNILTTACEIIDDTHGNDELASYLASAELSS